MKPKPRWLLILLLVAAGCSGASPTAEEPDPDVVDRVVIEGEAARLLTRAAPRQLTARALTAAGASVSVSRFQWTSSNPDVLTVDSEGQVRSVAPGTATVTAATNNVEGALTLTVEAEVLQTLSLTPDDPTLVFRSTIDQTIVRVLAKNQDDLPYRGEVSLAWASSDPTRATVDNFGLVLLPETTTEGNVTISATTGTVQAEATVAVSYPRGTGTFYLRATNNTILAGKLSLPQGFGAGPFPLAVMVHGSEGNGATKEVYHATPPLAHGMAVFSYDKRGIGESTGTYQGVVSANSVSTFDQLADDIVSVVQFIKNHPSIDAERIGVMGWSQGGYLNPLAASKTDDIAFMVNFVGTTLTVAKQIYFTQITGNWVNGTPNSDNNSSFTDAELAAMVDAYTGPASYDPMPYLQQINIPGRWVIGNKDYLAPYWQTVEDVQRLVNDFSKAYTIQTLEGGNHYMIHYQTRQNIERWNNTDGVMAWLRTIGML